MGKVKKGGFDTSGVPSIFYNMYFWLGVAVFILAIILIIYMFGRKEGFANSEGSTLEYFYMKSCPHCKTFDPVWEQLKTELPKENVNVVLKKYDISGDGEERARKFNVNGAPTILLTKNDALVKEYNGARTVEALKTFVKK